MATKSKWDDFSKRTSNRNLGLQVEDKIFWVSREELTKQSPIFDRMLNGEFKESQQDVIKLGEKTAEEILELLRVILPSGIGRSKQITGKNVENLMKLGDEYEMKEMMGKCSNFLMSKIIDGANIDIEQRMNYFTLAVQYKLKEVVRSALRPLAYMELPPMIFCFDRLPLEVRYAISLMRAAVVGPFKHEMVGVQADWHCENCCPPRFGCYDEFVRCSSSKHCKFCEWTICGVCRWEYPDQLNKQDETRCYICHNCGQVLTFNDEMAICE